MFTPSSDFAKMESFTAELAGFNRDLEEMLPELAKRRLLTPMFRARRMLREAGDHLDLLKVQIARQDLERNR